MRGDSDWAGGGGGRGKLSIDRASVGEKQRVEVTNDSMGMGDGREMPQQLRPSLLPAQLVILGNSLLPALLMAVGPEMTVWVWEMAE